MGTGLGGLYTPDFPDKVFLPSKPLEVNDDGVIKLLKSQNETKMVRMTATMAIMIFSAIILSLQFKKIHINDDSWMTHVIRA